MNALRRWCRLRAARRRSRNRRGARADLKGQEGLTLIEVLVSAVVLAIVVTPAFDAMVRARVLVAHRGEERIALRLVERKTEQLLAAGYNSQGDDSNIQSVNVTNGVHPTNKAILLVSRGDDDASNDVIGDLSWTVTATTWSDATSTYEDADYKVVEVKLAWPRGAHRDSVSIVTILGG
jgi:prepilin-type N-terminal cleavage/methylation domain-containing protein